MNKKLDPYIERLRSSGLRPTKQRVVICKSLFSRNATMHFTVEKLKKILDKKSLNKISQATIYNTVHAFKKKGYLKELPLKGNKTFFDTNTKNHHHFYDESKEELFDISNNEIIIKKIPEVPKGMKVESIEIVLKVASNNQNQKNK